MKFYLAGRFDKGAGLPPMGIKTLDLRKLGHDVTSSWILLDDPEKYPSSIQCAMNDFEDIDAADVMILILDSAGSKGGMYVEMGYAIASKKPLWIVGEKTNVFCWHPAVTSFPSWDAVLDHLRANQRREKTRLERALL